MTYSIEQFDREKTRVMKYIIYKKRTEQEVRNKFQKEMEEDLLEDIIAYLKEAGYISDEVYIEKAVREILLLRHLSKKEISYKLQTKGVKRDLIEKYFEKHEEELEDYEIESALHLMRKKIQDKELPEVERSLYTKGFTSHSVREAEKRLESEGK